MREEQLIPIIWALQKNALKTLDLFVEEEVTELQLAKFAAELCDDGVNHFENERVSNIVRKTISKVITPRLVSAIPQRFFSLKSLFLEKTKLHDAGAVRIADALKGNLKLNNLNLGNNDISYIGAAAIANVLKTNKSLRKLVLDYNEIGDLGVREIIGMMEENHHLISLSLRSIGVSDVAITEISEALKNNSTIKTINLCYNQIATSAIVKIAEMLTFNEGLRKISLSWNEIDDEEMVYLAEGLKSNGALRKLFLNHNRITSIGVKAIVDLLENNGTLRFLQLRHNQINVVQDWHDLLTAGKNLVSLELSDQQVNFDDDDYVQYLVGNSSLLYFNGKELPRCAIVKQLRDEFMKAWEEWSLQPVEFAQGLPRLKSLFSQRVGMLEMGGFLNYVGDYVDFNALCDFASLVTNKIIASEHLKETLVRNMNHHENALLHLVLASIIQKTANNYNSKLLRNLLRRNYDDDVNFTKIKMSRRKVFSNPKIYELLAKKCEDFSYDDLLLMLIDADMDAVRAIDEGVWLRLTSPQHDSFIQSREDVKEELEAISFAQRLEREQKKAVGMGI